MCTNNYCILTSLLCYVKVPSIIRKNLSRILWEVKCNTYSNLFLAERHAFSKPEQRSTNSHGVRARQASLHHLREEGWLFRDKERRVCADHLLPQFSGCHRPACVLQRHPKSSRALPRAYENHRMPSWSHFEWCQNCWAIRSATSARNDEEQHDRNHTFF